MAISEPTVRPIKVEHLLWGLQGPPASLETLVLLVAMATTALVMTSSQICKIQLLDVVELGEIACVQFVFSRTPPYLVRKESLILATFYSKITLPEEFPKPDFIYLLALLILVPFSYVVISLLKFSRLASLPEI